MHEPSLTVFAGCSSPQHLCGKASKSTRDLRQNFALVIFPLALENKPTCSSRKVVVIFLGTASSVCLWPQVSLSSLLFCR